MHDEKQAVVLAQISAASAAMRPIFFFVISNLNAMTKRWYLLRVNGAAGLKKRLPVLPKACWKAHDTESVAASGSLLFFAWKNRIQRTHGVHAGNVLRRLVSHGAGLIIRASPVLSHSSVHRSFSRQFGP